MKSMKPVAHKPMGKPMGGKMDMMPMGKSMGGKQMNAEHETMHQEKIEHPAKKPARKGK